MKTIRKRTHANDSGGRASSRAVNRPATVDLIRRSTEDQRWASERGREDAIPPAALFPHTTIA